MVGLLPETNAAAEADVLLDAWDFKGRPAPRASTGRWGAAAMILGPPPLLFCLRPPPGQPAAISVSPTRDGGRRSGGFNFPARFRRPYVGVSSGRPPRWHADRSGAQIGW